MTQPAFSVSRQRPRLLLRFTFAASISAGLTLSSTSVLASECGCNACGMAEVSMSDPCGCDAAAKKHNPLFRTLDALAGGIEKVLGLDKCKSSHGGCDEALCDGGCDASPYYEAMMPHPQSAPIMSESHSYQPVPPPPVVAPHQTSPRQSYGAPRSPMHMSQPRIQTPMPIQKRENVDSGGGSLFDNLSDPFSDEARRTQKQTIRPSAFTASKQTSSRRTSQR